MNDGIQNLGQGTGTPYLPGIQGHIVIASGSESDKAYSFYLKQVGNREKEKNWMVILARFGWGVLTGLIIGSIIGFNVGRQFSQ
jgi:hypothetical protein